ncbi:hypothetical protein PLESTB_000652000 [Pleodorina starrii]|uniref:Protein kinase domain-containing protein n=1 Tax=Pleodorina starrii TaxID=330485 RepID=A0A9W6BIA3_9CHLO|nr:hypothetical protein PLESTB_000652000 [Pleodorina starrii]
MEVDGGQGTFATVHKVLHNSSVVAVKVLRPEYAANREVVRMLLLEAALVASLTHPHIVRYRAVHPVAVGAGPPTQALLMEHLESGSLADLLSKQMKQPREHLYGDTEGLMWMLQIADALSYLHRREPAIIHRDVKPANVLLGPAAATTPGSGGKVSGRGLGLGLGLGAGGAGGGGGGCKGGPRLVANRVVKPGDHRPLIRVSSLFARASSSGIFHNPRVSGDGSLVLPASLMRTYERLRRPAAAGGGLAAAAADNDDDRPMGQCPLQQLDSVLLSCDGDSLGGDLSRRLMAPPLGATPSSLTFTSSAFLEMAQPASPLPPSSSQRQQRRSYASGGVAEQRLLKAPAAMTTTGMGPPSPFTMSTATGMWPSRDFMRGEVARAASIQSYQPPQTLAQPPRLFLSPGPRPVARVQQRGRPADDDDDDGSVGGGGGGLRQLEGGGKAATAGGEVGGGAGGATRPVSRLQLCAAATATATAAAGDVLGCAVPDAAAAAAAAKATGSQMSRLHGWFKRHPRANTVCGPLQSGSGAAAADGSVRGGASALVGRQAGGPPPVPFYRTSTAPRDGGGAAAAAAAVDGHGRCHVPIGHRRRSYSFGVSGGGGLGGGLAGGAIGGVMLPNSISADVGSGTPPLLERVFQFSGQCGSSIYMSPEVAQEQPYNEKADVFSFGMMLFEVVSRKLIGRTQEGRDGHAFTRLMVEGRRPLLPPCLDPRVAGLIGVCWHSDPLERPSMQQVVAVLQDVLYGDQVAAVAASPRASRRILPSGASVSFIVSGGGGGGGGGFKEDPSVTARYGSCVFAGAGASRLGGGGGGGVDAAGESHSLRTYDNPLSLEFSTSQARLLSLISTTTTTTTTTMPNASSANHPAHAHNAAAVDLLISSDVWNRNSPGGGGAAAAAARPATGGQRPPPLSPQQQQQPTELLRSRGAVTLSSPVCDEPDDEGELPCNSGAEPSRLLPGRGFGAFAAAPTRGSSSVPALEQSQIAARDPGSAGRAAAAPDRRAAAAAIVAAAAAAAARGTAAAAAAAAVPVPPLPSNAVLGTTRRAAEDQQDDADVNVDVDVDAVEAAAVQQVAGFERRSAAAAGEVRRLSLSAGGGAAAPPPPAAPPALLLLPRPLPPPMSDMAARPDVSACTSALPAAAAAAPKGSAAAAAAAAAAGSGPGLGPRASRSPRPSARVPAIGAATEEPRNQPGHCSSCCLIC